MKTLIQITLKDKTTICIPCVVKSTDDSFVKAEEILGSGGENVFLKITHHTMNTLMDLTRVVPCVLLYFDEDDQFISAAFNLDNRNGSFAVQFQSRKVLFLHDPTTVPIERMESVTLNSDH